MGRGRIVLLALGLAGLGFGAQQLLTGGNGTRLTSSLPWLAGVLVAHDLLLAPLLVGVGWALARVVPRRLLPAVAIILYVAAVVALIAAPRWLKPS